MASITYIDPQNNTHVVEVNSGLSVMQGALDNMIEGIVAECGGSCSCGTCHCYVENGWSDKLQPITEVERQTMECSIGVRENSRLSCQIKVTDELEGLVVRLPESQL